MYKGYMICISATVPAWAPVECSNAVTGLPVCWSAGCWSAGLQVAGLLVCWLLVAGLLVAGLG